MTLSRNTDREVPFFKQRVARVILGVEIVLLCITSLLQLASLGCFFFVMHFSRILLRLSAKNERGEQVGLKIYSADVGGRVLDAAEIEAHAQVRAHPAGGIAI